MSRVGIEYKPEGGAELGWSRFIYSGDSIEEFDAESNPALPKVGLDRVELRMYPLQVDVTLRSDDPRCYRFVYSPTDELKRAVRLIEEKEKSGYGDFALQPGWYATVGRPGESHVIIRNHGAS